MLILISIGLFNMSYSDTVFYNGPNSILGFLQKITFFEQIVFHGLIQISILSLLFFLLKKDRKESFFIKIAFVVFLEMVIAVQLNINFTGVNEHNPIELRKKLMDMPKDFPTPDNRQIKCKY